METQSSVLPLSAIDLRQKTGRHVAFLHLPRAVRSSEKPSPSHTEHLDHEAPSTPSALLCDHPPRLRLPRSTLLLSLPSSPHPARIALAQRYRRHRKPTTLVFPFPREDPLHTIPSMPRPPRTNAHKIPSVSPGSRFTRLFSQSSRSYSAGQSLSLLAKFPPSRHRRTFAAKR